MYYVDRSQIDRRLAILPELGEAAEMLVREWNPQDRLQRYALERVVHAALETVTDVGSLLIDGFLMRDASSYEDIITILCDEKVFAESLAEPLTRLVSQRKSLVQDFASTDRAVLLSLAKEFPEMFETFAASVRAFIAREIA